MRTARASPRCQKISPRSLSEYWHESRSERRVGRCQAPRRRQGGPLPRSGDAADAGTPPEPAGDPCGYSDRLLVSPSALACSVRGCGLPLTRRDRTLFCSAGHSFDIARSGYVNLLQPQDRRSLVAGDSKASVDARAALEQAGVGHAIVNAVVHTTTALLLPAEAIVIDLGSGSGEMLGGLAKARPISGIGIDLSVAAIELAARRFPSLTWVVANADRRLPLQDDSVNVVLSIHGRRNPSECARLLRASGVLIAVLPAPDDLVELRTV